MRLLRSLLTALVFIPDVHKVSANKAVPQLVARTCTLSAPIDYDTYILLDFGGRPGNVSVAEIRRIEELFVESYARSVVEIKKSNRFLHSANFRSCLWRSIID